MGQLKDFFEKNTGAFNDTRMPLGHDKRFADRIGYKKSAISLKIWYGVAAGFIFLAMLSFFARDYIFNKSFVYQNTNIVSLSDISFKYQEVEEFYQAGVDEKIFEFRHLQCKIDQEQMEMIDQELAEFDQNYARLQADLSRNMNDERVINAMITNYQTKLRFLELVIDQIKENC
jgi:hypothetical protein